MKTNTYIRISWKAEKTEIHDKGKIVLMSNSLLEPIHGVSLYDYAAVCAKMSPGIDTDDICNALGIDPRIFEKASAAWIARMQKDKTLEVAELFSKYFCEADLHPRLKLINAIY